MGVDVVQPAYSFKYQDYDMKVSDREHVGVFYGSKKKIAVHDYGSLTSDYDFRNGAMSQDDALWGEAAGFAGISLFENAVMVTHNGMETRPMTKWGQRFNLGSGSYMLKGLLGDDVKKDLKTPNNNWLDNFNFLKEGHKEMHKKLEVKSIY